MLDEEARPKTKKAVKKRPAAEDPALKPASYDALDLAIALKEYAVRLATTAEDDNEGARFMALVKSFNLKQFPEYYDGTDGKVPKGAIDVIREETINEYFKPKKNVSVTALKASLRPIYLFLKAKNHVEASNSEGRTGRRENELITKIIEDLVGSPNAEFPPHEVYQYFINCTLEHYKAELKAAVKTLAPEDEEESQPKEEVSQDETEQTTRFILNVRSVFDPHQETDPKETDPRKIIEEWHPKILRIFDAEFKPPEGGGIANKAAALVNWFVKKPSKEEIAKKNLRVNIVAIYNDALRVDFFGRVFGSGNSAPALAPVSASAPKSNGATSSSLFPSVQNLPPDMRKAEKAVQDAEAALGKITTGLKDIEQQINKNTAEQKTLTVICEKIKQEIQQKSDPKWIEAVRGKIADSESRLDGYKSQLQAAEQGLQENKLAIESNDREMTEANSQVLAKRQDLQKTNQEIGKITAKKNELEAECEKIRAEIQAPPSQLKQAENASEIASAQGYVKACKEMMGELQTKLSGNQAGIEVVDGQLTAATEKLAGCAEALETTRLLKNEIERLRGLIDDGVEKTRRLEVELQRLTRGHSDIEQKLTRLRGESESAERELEEIQTKKEELHEAESRIAAQIEDEKAKIRAKEMELQEIEGRKTQLDADLAELEEKYQEKAREKTQLEARIELVKTLLRAGDRPLLESKKQEAQETQQALVEKKAAITAKNAELRTQQAIMTEVNKTTAEIHARDPIAKTIEKNRWDVAFSLPLIGYLIRFIAWCFGVKDYDARVEEAKNSVQAGKDAELRANTARKQKAEQEREKIQAELGSLQSEQGELEQQIQTIAQELAEAQNTISESEAELAEQCAELDQVSGEQGVIVGEKEEKQAEKDKLDSECMGARRALSESKEALIRLQTEKEHLPLESELTLREPVLLRCLGGHREEESNSSATLEQLAQEIASTEGELASARQALDDDSASLQQKTEGRDSVQLVTELYAQIEKQKAAEEAAMVELTRYQDEKKILVAYGPELENKIRLNQDELGKYETALAEAKGKLEKEKEEQKELLAKKEAELEAAKRKFDRLTKKSQQFLSEIKQLSNNLNVDLTSEKQRLSKEKANLEKSKNENDQEVAREQEVLTGLNADLNRGEVLKQELEQKLKVFSELGKAQGTLRETQSKLNAELPNANKALADAQPKKVDLEKKQQALAQAKASPSKGMAVTRTW